VSEALSLIRQHDPIRYKRIVRDLTRIWVMLLPGNIGQFRESTWTCELDQRFILDGKTGPELIASAIVHEATHARLSRAGIEYEEESRTRIEQVCVRRQLAFAATLPNGTEARSWAEQISDGSPGDMSNAAMANRTFDGWIEAARHLGLPEWFVKWGIARQERRDRRRAAST
jgi:hypothetical protein